MIFISAGHHKTDPGAVANGHTEAALTMRIRNRVMEHLQEMGIPFIKDHDSETLSQYLNRIKSGSGSVVLEFHLDAGPASATGTTALVANNASPESKAFAHELASATASILRISNRGVKPESFSARGSLALMRESGIVCLLEVCFITNRNDVNQLLNPVLFDTLCLRYAQIVKKYEDMK